ncbi:hypothetical protein CU669_12755 [Paramagnetospirillum kuznetsovii]|uniref:Uncharacterized protein n=1 Tax=Paramagnetospirillum kuznetsovii TaxID=2053833 RepID=A0A364NXC2_9PROT|nr:hypothetical protein [Paramagnetospirillum kuznetsovii]RAU21557.1 hypothetical protein CU669_12755 [Paramagnetospirillum kuznetsovii]
MVEIVSFEAKFAANQAANQAQDAERIRQRDELSAKAFKESTDKVAASSAQASKATVVNGKDGAAAVSKALDSSTQIFAKLSDLRAEIADATKSGASLTEAQTKELNAKIAAVAVEVDKLVAKAKVGDTNLLEKNPGGVTVVSETGGKINIAGQDSGSKALGLADLKITDDASLRQATAAIAKATGKAELSVFRLQTADGVTGTPAPVNAGIAAFDKIRANSSTAPAAGSVSDSVAKALANQSAALAINYSGSGSLNSASVGSVVNLFA